MNYRPDIDGLRAVAVLPVILFHAGFSAFGGGFVGVDVFFVISGYLITSLIISDLSAGTFLLSAFYERRVRRIFPAFFVVCVCSALVAALWLLPQDMVFFSRSLLSAAVFVSNINFWREADYFDTFSRSKPLIHTRSLSIEEQFYLLFPVFLLALWKFAGAVRAILFGVAVLSLLLAEWSSHYHPVANFYWLPTRAWELLIGALVAIYQSRFSEPASGATLRQQFLSILGLSLIVYSIVAFKEGMNFFPGHYGLLPTLGTALLLLPASRPTIAGRLLSLEPLRLVGLISYSAYLWHQPLFAFARYRSFGEPKMSVFLLLSMAALILGYISWRYIEQPFRNRKVVARRTIFVFFAAGTTALIGAGLAGYQSMGFPQRFSKDVLAIVKIPDVHGARREKDGCNGFASGDTLPKCIKGDAKMAPEYAIIGDSFAESFVSALGHSFNSAGKSYIQYTRNGSAFADTLICRCGQDEKKFLNLVFKDIETSKVQTHIVSSMWSHYATDEDFYDCEGCPGSPKPLRNLFHGECRTDCADCSPQCCYPCKLSIDN